MKKEALTVIVVITLVLLAIGCTQQQQPAREKTNKTTSEAAKFSCENDNDAIQSRGYIHLLGLGNHDTGDWHGDKKLMLQDPKARFAVIYDQDETKHIDAISGKFLADTHELLEKYKVDELVILGSSAGGVTASYSIARLNFSGQVALHTMASPLKGYDLKGPRAAFLGNRQGYLRDIAIGFEPFEAPKSNVKVYHHKTVTDSVLKDYCGNMQAFCDVHEIQNNNIKGSKEFYHPEHDHETIVREVVRDVLKCYNEDAILPDAGKTPSLGTLCTGEETCNRFCEINFGRCKDYCQKNPENELCQKPFGFEMTANNISADD